MGGDYYGCGYGGDKGDNVKMGNVASGSGSMSVVDPPPPPPPPTLPTETVRPSKAWYVNHPSPYVGEYY